MNSCELKNVISKSRKRNMREIIRCENNKIKNSYNPLNYSFNEMNLDLKNDK